MNQKELFLEAINTMLWSWGGDAPPEVLWALGDFVKFINAEYNLELETPTEHDYYYNETDFHRKLEEFEKAINSL